jgi:hypothetical protein
MCMLLPSNMLMRMACRESCPPWPAGWSGLHVIVYTGLARMISHAAMCFLWPALQVTHFVRVYNQSAKPSAGAGSSCEFSMAAGWPMCLS